MVNPPALSSMNCQRGVTDSQIVQASKVANWNETDQGAQYGRHHFDNGNSADQAPDGIAVGDSKPTHIDLVPEREKNSPRSTDSYPQPGLAPQTIRDRSSFRSVFLQIGHDFTEFHHRLSGRHFPSSR